MISFVEQEGDITFPDSFSQKEFENMLQAYFNNEFLNDKVVQAAVMFFCTDFSEAEINQQLETLTQIMNQLTIKLTSPELLHKMSAVYGSPGLTPVLFQSKDIPQTEDTINKLRKLFKDSVKQDWRQVANVKKQSLLPDTSESEQDEESANTKSFILTSPGIVLSDVAYLTELLTTTSVQEVLMMLEILADLNTQFYKFKEIQLFAIQFLTQQALLKNNVQILKALDRLFDELSQFDIDLIKSQYQIINNTNVQNNDISEFILKYLLKPIENQPVILKLLKNNKLSEDSILKLSVYYLIFNPFQKFECQLEQRMLVLENPQQEADFINEDILQEIEEYVERNSLESLNTIQTGFIELVYQLRYLYLKNKTVQFDAKLFAELSQRTTLSQIQFFQLLVLSHSENFVDEVLKQVNNTTNYNSVLVMLNRHLLKNAPAQEQINKLIDVIQLSATNSELMNYTVAKYYKATLDINQSNLFLKDQTLIKRFLEQFNVNNEKNQELLVEMIMESDNLTGENIALVVQFVLQLISTCTDRIPSKFIYQLVDMMYDSYDISPLLCAALNGYIPEFKLSDNFYLKPSMLNLLSGYSRMSAVDAVTQLEQLLQASDFDLLADMNENEHLSNFFLQVLKIITKLSVDEYKPRRKSVNKLLKFVLAFPFTSEEAYLILFDEIQTQFKEQSEGVEIVFAFCGSLVENVLAKTPFENKMQLGFIFGILSLFGFEHNNLLFKNEFVDSKILIKYITDLDFAFDFGFKADVFCYCQLTKLLRNCAMHDTFKLDTLLILYQKLISIAVFVVNQQIASEQATVLFEVSASFIFVFLNNNLISNLFGSFSTSFEATKIKTKNGAKINKLEQQQQLLELTTTILTKIVNNEDILDLNSVEILSSYFFEMVEKKKIKCRRELVEKAAQKFEELQGEDEEEENED
ncbi:Conserved_hypothetical protein [Hexamita inflata]|uniref:Uncharacterized protein n=1 Tax=Hexamita inflata TaxID=28002 RepID=A0AA86NHN4_9EUKA|nr:Conserved hypothetical protein [Hexamita inflata]